MRDWTISIEAFVCGRLLVVIYLSENWDDLNNAAKVLIYQTKGWEKNHLLIRIILIRSLLSFCFSLLFTVFVSFFFCYIIIIILQLQQKETLKIQQNEKQVWEEGKERSTKKKYQEMPWKQIFLPFVLMHNMNNIFLSPFYFPNNKITNEKWCKSV